MGLAIGDEQELLADAVSRFAGDRCTPEVARAALDAPPGEVPACWAELDELGWLTYSPADGLRCSDLAVVLEGLGRAVAPGPILPTAWARAVAQLAGADLTGPAAVAPPDAPVLGGAAARQLVVSRPQHPGTPSAGRGVPRARAALARALPSRIAALIAALCGVSVISPPLPAR